jgi:hypothetical protein
MIGNNVEVGTLVLTMHIPQDIGCGMCIVRTHAFSSRSKISFGLKRRSIV